jgi:putative sigma-54 modulation protein
MMDLQIQGRNIEITRSMKEHVTAKLGALDRHLPSIARADVEMASESTRSQQDRVVVQVSLTVGGDLLRAQRRAGNARAAVNAAVDALDRQVNRWKSQTYRSERMARLAPDADSVVEAMASEGLPQDEAEVATAEPSGDLVRTKQFDMDPMSVENAALQMQYLDHSFYMFLDEETNRYSVLYRRADDNYGLIQPTDR